MSAMPSDAGDVTRFLVQWSKGDSSALDRLTPLVYEELHKLASHYLRGERPQHTLQPTALVHEAYVRLVRSGPPDWDGRSHFYAFAAHLMRQILVDYARRQSSAKRDCTKISLDQSTAMPASRAADVLDLHDALSELDNLDPRKGRIIELRYFAGMQVEETAKVMDLSVATIRRELRMAEAWLHRALAGEAPGGKK
jgi:RNA polymerase sigma factor (TIGR02999 family)